MYDETLRFHQLTKNREAPQPLAAQAPISHTRVFHKEYPRFEAIELPRVETRTPLQSLWERRRSQRAFTPEALTLDDLGALLGSCAIIDAEREPERRAYPSAGARFPVELYLAAFRIHGLQPGCYHYKVRTHELEVLWPEELASRADQIVSPFVSDPAAALIMTSVISRSEVKYGHKSYPFSLLEAGHMAQNIQLAAASRAIGSCAVGGFVDDAISSLFDLTQDEPPLYVLALGKVDPAD